MIIRRGRAATDEIVPLSDRLAVLQAVRVVIAVAVVMAAALEPDGQSLLGLLATATGPYLALTLLAEWARHRVRARALPLVRAMLLIDVLYLGAVMIATGGPQSHLSFLVYLHLVAVTLLVSYRTGLRVALAHSTVLFVAYVARRAGSADPPSWLVAGDLDDLRRAAVFGSAGFWLVAIGTAVLSSLSERELRRGKRELRALAEMGSALEDVSDADEVNAVLLAGVAAGFGTGRTAVARWDGGRLRVSSGAPPSVVTVESDRPDAVAVRAWRSGEPVLVKDLDPLQDALFHALLPWAQNVIVIPLMADGEPLGALAVAVGGRRRVVPNHMVEMLGQFATHAALAMRNADLLAEVRRLAAVDALTGLANRGALQVALEREAARAARSGQPLTLVLFDVDHFKAVNDEHGHQVGDEVLRAVGRVLLAGSRATDVAGRYGGEEFCVVLPGCRGRAAAVITERLRAAVAAGSPVPVTLSAGLASLPTNAGTVEELLQAADEALYASKTAGRDRTTRSRRRRPGGTMAA